jgi:lysophospholipase L1-like esterase
MSRVRIEKSFVRFKSTYRNTAIILINTVVFVVALNVFLYAAFFIRDVLGRQGGQGTLKQPSKPTQRGPDDGRLFNSDGSPASTRKRTDYQLEWFDYNAYSEGKIPGEYVSNVLDDFYEHSLHGFKFQPWVHFSEPEFDGKLFHIDLDARGFPIRRTRNPKTEGLPVANVFVLGGSTSLGYNVSDEHTWPSYLSAILNSQAKGIHIEVTNYGHEYFNPSQEAILLADLLKSGHRPSIVLFMHGVNEPTPTDVPVFTKQVSEGFRAAQFPPSYADRFQWIPVMRLANHLRRRFSGTATTSDILEPPVHTDRHVATAINGFQQSRDIAKAIAGVYGVPTLFFLQPNALYNYDLSLYRLTAPQSFLDYRRFMIAVYSKLKADPGYIDLSALFDQWGRRKAVVDDVHYSPAFNQFLAERVAKWIDVGSLQLRSIDENAATGIPRQNPVPNQLLPHSSAITGANH